MPRSTMFRAAVRRPSRVLNGLGPGGADRCAALVQDAVGVGGFHPPDEVAAFDQALVSLVDRIHVDAVVQGGADDGPHGRVHPGGVAAAGENSDAGWCGLIRRHVGEPAFRLARQNPPRQQARPIDGNSLNPGR